MLPRLRPRLGRSLNPLRRLGPQGNPLTRLQEQPLPFRQQQRPGTGRPVDECEERRKRKRKPRKPRAVCYRGTYRETSSSTSKRRLEEIPCESAKRQVKGAVLGILGSGDPLGELQTRARTVAGTLGRRAYVGAVEAARRKLREQLGEKWVPLTPEEKRKRRAAAKAAELKRLRRELREAKRKRS